MEGSILSKCSREEEDGANTLVQMKEIVMISEKRSHLQGNQHRAHLKTVENENSSTEPLEQSDISAKIVAVKDRDSNALEARQVPDNGLVPVENCGTFINAGEDAGSRILMIDERSLDEKYCLSKKLKKHIKIHSKIKAFQCDMCGRILKTKQVLRKHQLMHKNHFVCNFCFRKQASEYDLHNHICFGKVKNPECPTCGRAFKRIYDLKRHMKSHNSKTENAELERRSGEMKDCHICGESCPIKKLDKHIQSHTDVEVYQCDQCGRILKNKKCLRKHKLIHLTHIVCPSCFKKVPSEEEFKKHICYNKKVCEVCNKSFKSNHDLKIHMRMHIKDEEAEADSSVMDGESTSQSNEKENIGIKSKKVKLSHRANRIKEETDACYICGEYFTLRKLKKHIKSHTNVETFPCDQCTRILKTKKILKRHKLIHQKYVMCPSCYKKLDSEEDFKFHVCYEKTITVHACDTCGKCFKTKSDLTRHIRTHTQEKPFECKYCGHAFTQKTNRDNHVKRRHTRDGVGPPIDKTYVCEICLRAFISKRNLERHSIIHSGEKPFVCEICSKGFTQSQHMKNHVKEVHCTSKDFHCEICGRSYFAKRNLVEHLKTHGEPTFFCSVCDRGFHTSVACDRHYLTHTKFKPYICDFCHKAYARESSLINHYKNHALGHLGKKAEIQNQLNKVEEEDDSSPEEETCDDDEYMEVEANVSLYDSS